MEERAREQIDLARKLAERHLYDKAFRLFLSALKRDSGLARFHEDEFHSLLRESNSALAESNRIDAIFDNFGKASDIYPNNAHLLNDIGKYLYKYGYYKEAQQHFETVLSINPGHVDAEKNLNSIKNFLVERWHYRMLNDSIRNERYKRAIEVTVATHGAAVLDVGTGTGLLAAYARAAGARAVCACDGSDVMARLAADVFRYNGMHNVRILNKMSGELTLTDTAGESSLLLTEMFDAGLFGEHVLQMLSHARPALLTPDARILPGSAEFFVEGACSEYLTKNYRLCSATKEILHIPSLEVGVETHDETYDCEDVHSIPDIKYLTEPRSVLKVNFNDPDDIKNNLERVEPYDVELKSRENGIINIVVGWFNLYLSENITITTNPRATDRANAWQQAVFFDNSPVYVAEDEKVLLKFLMNGGKLTMVPDGGNIYNTIYRVSSEMIRFLNDSEYVNVIAGCIDVACARLERMAEMCQVRVADLCPFPVFGMMMLKRGARSLLCCARSDNDKRFIEKVCEANGVSLSNVIIVHGNEWTLESLGEEKYHAVFSHALELCGDVDVRMSAVAAALSSRLERGGLQLPTQLNLVAQLVSSHWLDSNNRLYDVNVGDYGMAARLNRYSVTQNFCIDFSVLKYVPISDPVVLCSYPTGSRYEDALVGIQKDGYANAILCWYNIQIMDEMKEISTNRSKSFIDGMLFLTYPKTPLVAGTFVKIIQHKDEDGCFKLVME